MKILDWLDDRTGYRAIAKKALDEPVLGGASLAYVFGSVLVFLLILQMTTGVLLAFYYSPSATDAWASVAHINDQVALGWLVRGLHHHGASAMVIVCGLHMLQVAIWGAYKKPRELNWIIGVMMLGLILAFALTGYLLPWDQTGYWATKVATGIAGSTPVVGEQVQQGMQGGNEYGNLTLTRFYALHVFVLPALMIGLLSAHLVLFRRHGVTPSWRKTDAELRRTMQPFWPDQLFRDVVAMAVVFAALFAYTWSQHGARLDAPADPASGFDARPEWYFRPLFQMLKYFQGKMETVAALGVPAIVGAVLIALPFLDRGESRSPMQRKLPLGLLGAGAVVAGALTVLSFQADRNDDALVKREHEAQLEAKRARRLAKEHGVPSAGGVAVYTTAPFYEARALWTKHCGGCHGGDARKGPLITAGYNSRAWIRDFFANPDAPEHYGVVKGFAEWDSRMPPVKVKGPTPDDRAIELENAGELDALVEMVYGETGAEDADPKLVVAGKAKFDELCIDCHARELPPDMSMVPPPPPPPAVDAGAPAGDDEEAEEAEEEEEEEPEVPTAPNLFARGTPDYLVALMRHPADPRFYGEHNKMKPFAEELGPEDLQLLAEWLVWLRTHTEADIAALDAP